MKIGIDSTLGKYKYFERRVYLKQKSDINKNNF